MKTKIVGTQFAMAVAEGISEGHSLTIAHDPENQYDKNALAVIYNNERIGFIGKGTDVYDINRERFPMQGVVIDFYIKEEGDQFTKHQEGTLVSCLIKVADLVKLIDENDVMSFNEEGVVINFDETPHIYTHKGTILKGATTYIKKYIEDFDSEGISVNCEKYWQIPAPLIRKAWKLAGTLSSTFGTGIHKALEFEDLYRSYTKPKDGSRCFTIKHPTIRRIVEEFYELSEALISDVESGHCALADRVLLRSWKDKICRLQDYKVNHSFDKKGEVKFKNLPKGLDLTSTKLSKLSLQLKFQANMLEKSGWTIEGFDGFVYTDKWEYYEANTLDGFNILEGTME